MIRPGDDGDVAALRRYVSEVVGCPDAAITAVSRFEHGNRHSVHRVTCATGGPAQDVVVRVSFGGERADVAQATREAAVLTVVGGIAGPELLDFRPTSAWFGTPAMCLEYLRGSSRDLDAVGPGEIEELAALVAWVHQRPPESVGDSLGPATTVKAYAEDRLHSILATLAWARDPLPRRLQGRLRSAADAVASGFGRAQDAPHFSVGGTLSLLHGDIAPGNVLWTPSPRLIDWEYCRLGDPADEIAYTFDQNALTAAQREAFWSGYANGLRDRSRLADVAERVGWWELATLLGSALWWVERWVRRSELNARSGEDAGVPREAAYYFDRVTSRIDRLERRLGAQRPAR